MSRFEACRGCLDPAVSSESLRRWIKKMALIAVQQKQPLGSLDAVCSAVVGCVEGVQQALYDFDLVRGEGVCGRYTPPSQLQFAQQFIDSSSTPMP